MVDVEWMLILYSTSQPTRDLIFCHNVPLALFIPFSHRKVTFRSPFNPDSLARAVSGAVSRDL
jgi:hypothetical protein